MLRPVKSLRKGFFSEFKSQSNNWTALSLFMDFSSNLHDLRLSS